MTANAFVRARRPQPLAFAVLLALASGDAGFAQTRLYLLTSGDPSWECDVGPCNPGRVIQIDVDRRQITASTPIEHARGFTTGPGITPDGGFLIWGGSETSGGWDEIKPVVVSLFDLASQRQSILLASQQSVPVFVHPSKMRAFVQLAFSQPLTVLEPGQVRAQPSPSCGYHNNNFLDRISGDGGRLSYYCAGIDSGVIVVDSTDGRVAGTVLARVSAHALDDDGRTVFTVDRDAGRGRSDGLSAD